MIRVYNYMAAGVALTGVVAWLTYSAAVVTDAAGHITGLTPFGQAIFGGPLTIVLFLGTLGIVFFMSFRINTPAAEHRARAVHALCRIARADAVVGVPRLYRRVDHPHLLHLGGLVRRAQPLRLHARSAISRRSARSW